MKKYPKRQIQTVFTNYITDKENILISDGQILLSEFTDKDIERLERKYRKIPYPETATHWEIDTDTRSIKEKVIMDVFVMSDTVPDEKKAPHKLPEFSIKGTSGAYTIYLFHTHIGEIGIADKYYDFIKNRGYELYYDKKSPRASLRIVTDNEKTIGALMPVVSREDTFEFDNIIEKGPAYKEI